MIRKIALTLAIALTGAATTHSAWCVDVEVAEAPANDLQLTLSAIGSAEKSIFLNIYELSSPEIADALLERIQAGVQVQILEEAQPVGGMSSAAKGIVSQLIQAMQNGKSGDRFLEMTSKAGGKRRFRYDHAKYAVIDGDSVLVGSENYSPTGNPQAGSVGNRGWEVLIHDTALASQFQRVFESDTDTSHQDVMVLTDSPGRFSEALTTPVPPRNPGQRVPNHPVLKASSIQQITSPDTSLSGLTEMLRSARKSIDIEQMTFDPGWGKNGGQSKLLDEVLAAANRGVHVRVLMNDETVFDHPSHPSKPKNRATLQLLKDATDQGLPIEARIADLKAMGVDYIHNKGVVVDGDKTLISSINWDENAVEKNREAAVLITSPEIYAHYEALFQSDWDASSGNARQAQRFSASVRIDTDNDEITCPERLAISATIGQITLGEHADQSFNALSGERLDLSLARETHSRGCILMTPGRSSSKKTLEIRKNADGQYVYSLEGYTGAGKLYSIRAKTDEEITPTTGALELFASIYDGSGPGHRRIGSAELSITY